MARYKLRNTPPNTASNQKAEEDPPPQSETEPKPETETETETDNLKQAVGLTEGELHSLNPEAFENEEVQTMKRPKRKRLVKKKESDTRENENENENEIDDESDRNQKAAKTSETGAATTEDSSLLPVKLEKEKAPPSTPTTPTTPPAKLPEKKIEDALKKASVEYEGEEGEGTEEYASEEYIKKLTQEIMQALEDKHTKDSKEYKRRLRTLCTNLVDPKNLDFRSSVLVGKLSPSDLSTMETKDMASNELKKKRALIHQQSLNARTLDAETAAEFSTVAASQMPMKLEVLGKSNVGKDEVMEFTQEIPQTFAAGMDVDEALLRKADEIWNKPERKTSLGARGGLGIGGKEGGVGRRERRNSTVSEDLDKMRSMSPPYSPESQDVSVDDHTKGGDGDRQGGVFSDVEEENEGEDKAKEAQAQAQAQAERERERERAETSAKATEAAATATAAAAKNSDDNGTGIYTLAQSNVQNNQLWEGSLRVGEFERLSMDTCQCTMSYVAGNTEFIGWLGGDHSEVMMIGNCPMLKCEAYLKQIFLSHKKEKTGHALLSAKDAKDVAAMTVITQHYQKGDKVGVFTVNKRSNGQKASYAVEIFFIPSGWLASEILSCNRMIRRKDSFVIVAISHNAPSQGTSSISDPKKLDQTPFRPYASPTSPRTSSGTSGYPYAQQQERSDQPSKSAQHSDYYARPNSNNSYYAVQDPYKQTESSYGKQDPYATWDSYGQRDTAYRAHSAYDYGGAYKQRDAYDNQRADYRQQDNGYRNPDEYRKTDAYDYKDEWARYYASRDAQRDYGSSRYNEQQRYDSTYGRDYARDGQGTSSQNHYYSAANTSSHAYYDNHRKDNYYSDNRSYYDNSNSPRGADYYSTNSRGRGSYSGSSYANHGGSGKGNYKNKGSYNNKGGKGGSYNKSYNNNKGGRSHTSSYGNKKNSYNKKNSRPFRQ